MCLKTNIKNFKTLMPKFLGLYGVQETCQSSNFLLLYKKEILSSGSEQKNQGPVVKPIISFNKVVSQGFQCFR